MKRRWAILPLAVCVALCAFASTASASTAFHPRVKGALGLIPPVNSKGQFGAQDFAAGEPLTPVTYHGGQVLTGGVTIHTIFWTGGTNPFNGSPGAGILGHEALIKQFYTDVAHDSTGISGGACTTTSCNVFTVAPQFAQESGVGGNTPPGVTSGQYTINYNAATNSIDDTHPYPAQSSQCASPQSTAICITDPQVQAEIDREITLTGGSRGLHDIWFVFLPPGVDECISPGVCGTNAFGGYHSLSNVGHGTTIYSLIIDPSIETANVFEKGKDPQGNPDAEITADIAAHETFEAITDPTGIGYLDPNGFETGDKCELGPQQGTPLGFAGPDNAPFNQVINGHKYLLQEMWANSDNNGNPNCVQATTSTNNQLPLPQVNMTQFSPTVTGNTGSSTGGVPVSVALIRAGNLVALASTTTDPNGNWSVTLQHPVGDDRDAIRVTYNHGNPGPGVPSPASQVILTGNGGNPFTESGWTGWFALDNGAALTNTDPETGNPSLSLAPCFQTGVLFATLNGGPLLTSPHGELGPTDYCSTQTDVADMPVITPFSNSDVVTQGSNDNRAFSPPGGPTPNPFGGLVKLTVPVGEPDSISAFGNPLPFFLPTGFPLCTADLQAQMVSCSGLSDSNTYSLTDGAHQATGLSSTGGFLSASLPVKGGDSVVLSNGSRNVTTLHVANLRVDIAGEQTVLSGGSCQPDQYYGPPTTVPPTNGSAGAPGVADTGQVCPSGGDASGLPASFIGQTDETSGGLTQTEVPHVEDTSPMQAETVYGSFTALAESGFPGPNNSVTPDNTSTVALDIAHASGGPAVFHAANVDTANGLPVNGLTPGTYKATWTLTDINGDTRTVTTRFIEQSAMGSPGPQGPQGPQGQRGPQGPRGPRGPAGPKPKVTCKLVKHNKIKCTVTFPKSKDVRGNIQVRIAQGSHVLALGHARLGRGGATLTMRELRRMTRRSLTITLVLSRPHAAASTRKMSIRVR